MPLVLIALTSLGTLAYKVVSDETQESVKVVNNTAPTLLIMGVAAYTAWYLATTKG